MLYEVITLNLEALSYWNIFGWQKRTPLRFYRLLPGIRGVLEHPPGNPARGTKALSTVACPEP